MIQKTDFWKKVMDTLALLGSLTTGGMGAMQQWADAHITGAWYVASGVIAILSLVLRIWITDQDGDGKVDILQK